MTEAVLFSAITIRGFTSRNRIAVSPMQQYASTDGTANDYHLVHLGRFALGGAGMVIAEATAIEPCGRMSRADLGLWSDQQIEPLARIVRFLKAYKSVPGIQLVHAGRKGAIHVPWLGLRPLTDEDRVRGDPPWPLVGPSRIAAGPGWQLPEDLSEEQLRVNVAAWRAATRRAVAAGFEIVELHGAHGYLLHSFLSPIANRRSDRFGGDLFGRMRFPLAVIDAVRSELPADRALFYRLSALDGIEGGLTLDETAVFAKELFAHGVDVVDCSSGGIISDRSIDTRLRRGFAFNTPYSRYVRQACGGLVSTAGLIVDAHQAERILQAGDADIIAVGRELLADPNWPHRARAALCGETFDDWHQEAGWWLERRAAELRRLANEGETPMSRYEKR